MNLKNISLSFLKQVYNLNPQLKNSPNLCGSHHLVATGMLAYYSMLGSIRLCVPSPHWWVAIFYFGLWWTHWAFPLCQGWEANLGPPPIRRPFGHWCRIEYCDMNDIYRDAFKAWPCGFSTKYCVPLQLRPKAPIFKVCLILDLTKW